MHLHMLCRLQKSGKLDLLGRFIRFSFAAEVPCALTEIKIRGFSVRMILAAECRLVSRAAKHIDQILAAKYITDIMVGAHVVAGGIAPRKHTDTSGNTTRIRCIRTTKISARRGKTVEVRHGIQRISAAAPQIRALLVGHNDHNVRSHSQAPFFIYFTILIGI